MVGTNVEAYNWYNLEPNFRMYLSAVKNVKPISTKNYLSDLRYFFGWLSTVPSLAHAQPLDALTPSLLNEFRSYLVDGDLPERTINRRLSTLRAFCEFLVSQNIIAENPSKALRNFTRQEQSTVPFKDALSRFEKELQQSSSSELDVERQMTDINEFLQIINKTK